MNWETLDWTILDRLRERFLAGGEGGETYWSTRADLAHYDFTFAQRIGWKWDAVLHELSLRGWQPPAGPLLDWGCGSGIAGRAVLGALGTERFGSLALHDRSTMAATFAAERARQEFPELDVQYGTDAPFTTLLVSHVLNELDPAGRDALRAQLGKAKAVLWVEPGTYQDSRGLIAAREELLAAGFDAVAPCTHRERCGMLNAHNETHWCHHFADPPPSLLSDAGWNHFARRVGIDLRAIPYSFLVLERRALANEAAGWTRVIGKPRVYKGYAKVLGCSHEDVAELPLQERDHKALFRAIKKDLCPTLLRVRDGAKEWKVVEEMK